MEIEPQCDVEKLSAVIQFHIPHATLEKYTEAELSFILPKEYIDRYKFREFQMGGLGDQKLFLIFQV